MMSRAASQWRTSVAIATGVLVTLLVGYLGVIVFVLATIGLPLGAESKPLTATDAAVLLLLAGGAAAAGGRAAARIAFERRGASVSGVCLLLAAIMLWGFSGRNWWPDWWDRRPPR
jgi:hypothetical protein